MAKCSKCDKKIGFLSSSDGMCLDCASAAFSAGKGARLEAERLAALAQTTEAIQHREAGISAVIVTTETHTNLNITKRIKIIVATVESSFDAKLVEKQDELVFGLKTECYDAGGNAVVGVTFNSIETYSASIGAGNFKKFKMVAYGTAVVVEK